MIKYIARSWMDRISEIEVLSETEKTVTTKSGRRDKDCESSWIRDTPGEAKAARVKHFKEIYDKAVRDSQRAADNYLEATEMQET